MSAVDWQLELSLLLAGWANLFFPAHASPFPSFIPISIFFFSASRFPSSIQSRAICPQSTFFIFYATLSFKAFCSWLATELLPISSESSPSSCAHRSSSQSSPSVPEAARLGVHLGVCLSGCGSPQGFQLPGAWPSGGEEEHRRAASRRHAVVNWGAFRTEKRNLVFNLK